MYTTSNTVLLLLVYCIFFLRMYMFWWSSSQALWGFYRISTVTIVIYCTQSMYSHRLKRQCIFIEIKLYYIIFYVIQIQINGAQH